jgi:hypothetical protein
MKRTSELFCAFACCWILGAGCGDDAGDHSTPHDNETGGSGGVAGTSDSDASAAGGSSDEDLGPRTIEEATWHSVWRECGTREDGACYDFERCAFWTDDQTSLCTSACDDVDDCVDPDHPAGKDFSAEVACVELPGSHLSGRQCVLACTETAECGEIRACSNGICVWRDVGATSDDAGL